ncbi:hypothetical protein NRB20_65890 [Nocardia sp. RB20]|uniref:Uncharacterized protein n=1 Tax=Nocardia macrotermitis TaxID=2585198 RepID=A0A7K0DCW0_9NOCA|nr:hypothetical protein [Nocardia macrotermitis]
MAWAMRSRTVWRTNETIAPASSTAEAAVEAALAAVVIRPVVVAAWVLYASAVAPVQSVMSFSTADLCCSAAWVSALETLVQVVA